LLSWLLTSFSGVDVPGEVQAAMGAIASAIVGYFFMGGRSNATNS